MVDMEKAQREGKDKDILCGSGGKINTIDPYDRGTRDRYQARADAYMCGFTFEEQPLIS